MTHHVIHEETNPMRHVLLARFGEPLPPPDPAHAEAMRLLLAGRRVSVTVIDAKTRPSEWPKGISTAAGKSWPLAAIHRRLLALVRAEPVSAGTCPDCGEGMFVTRAHGDDGRPFGGRLLARCDPCYLSIALTDEADQ